MAAKSSFLFVCASACLFKIISAQCIGAIGSVGSADELLYGAGFGSFGAAPLGSGAQSYGGAPGYGFNTAPFSGGSFAVTSFSPISPTGISVVSENTFEGPLSIVGELPFLGAISLEGALPTTGAGAINYGCGSGTVAIVSEGVAPAGSAYPGGPGLGGAALPGVLGYAGLPAPRPLNGLAQGAGIGCRGFY